MVIVQFKFDLFSRTDSLLSFAILNVSVGLSSKLNSISLLDDEGEVIVNELSGVIVEMLIPTGSFQADKAGLFACIVLIAGFITYCFICSDLHINVLDK